MALLIYLVKVSLCTGLVYLVYRLVLERQKFLTWNRWYLLLFFILSFVFPLIPSGYNIGSGISYTFYSHTGAMENPNAAMDWAGKILLVIFIAGVWYFLFRFFYGWYLLRRNLKTAHLVSAEPYRLYYHNNEGTFSWGKIVFIGKDAAGADLQKILQHEFAHIRQAHYIDVYLTQILCIITWFNPFSWKLRNAALTNLEFLADEQVLQNGTDLQEYQLELIKSAACAPSGLNLFFSSGFQSLKKRFIMMNKEKPKPLQKLRFLLVLPLSGLMLVLFSSADVVAVPNVYQLVNTDTLPKEKAAVYRQIHVTNGKAEVRLYNGTTEYYDLNKASEKKEFESKYGELPPAPPPPPVPERGEEPVAPPPPPDPPVMNGKGTTPPPPAPPAPPQVLKDGKAIPPPPPPVPRVD